MGFRPYPRTIEHLTIFKCKTEETLSCTGSGLESYPGLVLQSLVPNLLSYHLAVTKAYIACKQAPVGTWCEEQFTHLPLWPSFLALSRLSCNPH